MTAEIKKPDALRIGRLPIHFFTTAVISFACGVVAAPFLVGQIVDFFYQPPILALVHTFTLGWITASIMGVMYRYVPALTRHPIAYPRVAMWQLALFIIGTIGIVSHFANGIWVGTWFSAGILIVSVAMFAANMIPCLYPHLGRGVAETGNVSLDLLFVRRSIDRIRAVARQDLQLSRRRRADQPRESRPFRGHRMGDADHLRGVISDDSGVPAPEAPFA